MEDGGGGAPRGAGPVRHRRRQLALPGVRVPGVHRHPGDRGRRDRARAARAAPGLRRARLRPGADRLVRLGGGRAEGDGVDPRRALHRRGRRAVRADRHRAGDPAGAVDLAADQGAGVARRSDRARRPRRPGRDHVVRRDRPARRELQLHGRPDLDPARADRREGPARAGARDRQDDPGHAGAERRAGRSRRAQVRRVLSARGADRRRLVDLARADRRQGDARGRRRHRPRRAVGDDHRGGQGGVRRRALRLPRRRHGVGDARDHEPRDLRERAAPVRDDVLRVDLRPAPPHDHVRQRRPQLPVPVPHRRGPRRVRLADDPRQPARRRSQLALRGQDHRSGPGRRPDLVHRRHRRVRERRGRGVR